MADWTPGSERDESGAAYGLAYRFLDQSESYVLGFEAGTVARLMSAGARVDQLIHDENDEQIMLMARHYGYRVHLTPIGEGWTELHATKEI